MVIEISLKYQNLLGHVNDEVLAFYLCVLEILNYFHSVVGENIKDLLPRWQ